MTFEQQLSGGKPNSLGNTLEVVQNVQSNPSRFKELFHCFFSDDPLVRLRTTNALRRLTEADKTLTLPYVDALIDDVSRIDQASIQWTLAQLFLLLEKDLNPQQKQKAVTIMKSNLANHHDWIVLNMSLKTLGKWAEKDERLKDWIWPHLDRLIDEPRKSISSKARQVFAKLSV